MTDVVLAVATEEPGEEVTLLGEDDEKQSIVAMIDILRTSVILQKQTIDEKSPLGCIRRRAWLRTRRRKASKYRKNSTKYLDLIFDFFFFGFLGFRPAVICLQKNLYPPSLTWSPLLLRWNLT